jgi:murein DD-endopeptidase MepM/ murein hydrolase activator NlpD
MKTSVLTTIILLFSGFSTFASPVLQLDTLDSRNPVLAQLRNDVKKAIIASRTASPLPDLQFYTYTISEKDTFWTILSRTGLNVDTVMTANALSGPWEIKKGGTLFLPNMRGIIYEVKKTDTLESMEKTFGIKKDLILSANRISSLSKKFIFLPGGGVTSLERSLFLGTGFAAPLAHLRRTSGFGMRHDPISGEKSFHTGVDLGCEVGTPVYAAREGKVIQTGYTGNYGQLVIVEHPCGYYSYYGHLSRIKVRVGQKIVPNDIIAMSGNTGRTTGPHLHFEIRKNAKPVNPIILLR